MIVLILIGIAVCVLVLLAIRQGNRTVDAIVDEEIRIERANKRARIVSTIPGPRHADLDDLERSSYGITPARKDR